jgi:hypothetical protein
MPPTTNQKQKESNRHEVNIVLLGAAPRHRAKMY